MTLDKWWLLSCRPPTTIRATRRSRQCAPEAVGIIGELPDPALRLGIVRGVFCARLGREFCTAVCELRCSKEMALVFVKSEGGGGCVCAIPPRGAWTRHGRTGFVRCLAMARRRIVLPSVSDG